MTKTEWETDCVKEVRKVAEQLIETYPCDSCNVEFCYRRCYKMTLWAEKAKKKLAEYETAEEEERLVVLPCKSGKDLFGIYNGTIVEGYADGYLLEKTSVHSDADHWIWLQDKNSKNYWKIAFAEIGKTVFLTREEAEKALRDLKEQ